MTMMGGKLCKILLLVALWGMAVPLSAQKSPFHLIPPFQSFKIDIKTGSAAILSEVPAKYLNKLNRVNVPIDMPGVNLSLFTRKALTGHFEFGYQLNYINLYGKVKQQPNVYQVHTQVLENSYHFCFNLLRTDYFRPLNNCYLYYKIGAITLKNDPRLRLPDGSLQDIPGVKAQRFFFSNGVTVGTGVGVGFNRQLTPNFALVGTFEFSRSSDSADDIFRINKIFYNSPNTVSKYMALSFGISYTFDLVKPKNENSPYFKARSETEKQLHQAQIARQKKRTVRKW